MLNSPLVFGVDVSSVMKQILDHRHSVITSRKVERRGMAPLQVPTVHILRAAQLLGDRNNLLDHTPAAGTLRWYTKRGNPPFRTNVTNTAKPSGADGGREEKRRED